MADQDAYLNINSDDSHATRVFSLAIKFFGSSYPLAASSLKAEFYPTLDTESFRRQYLRDRNLLASLGIVVLQVGERGDDTLWQVDEHQSYVEGEGLGADEARMLFILCHDMAYDQSFPYRDELRVALAKISQMYRGTVLPQTDNTSPQEHKKLATLVSSMSNQQAASVRYTDAQGVSSDRVIAILGSFGLRNHTYFVASRIERDGSLTPDSIRTYRLDRFDKVSPKKPPISYQIPLDFTVRDYERLPFQIGDFVGMASIDLGSNPSREVRRATQTGQSQLTDSCWNVPYSNAQALAAWCIGNKVTPQSPQTVVDTWHDLLERTSQASLHDDSLNAFCKTEHRTTSRRQAGRVGSAMVIRQLMALASSLTKEGDVITADQVAQTLGIDYERARHLIMLITLSGGESYDYLPVVPDEEYREVFLMEGAQLSAPRVRLTRAETIALLAALTELGVSDDDPLYTSLTSTFAAPAFSVDDISRSLELPSSIENTETLQRCSQAITDQRCISFTYRPVTGGAPSRRTVAPLFVRRSDDNWYLDAFDLSKQDHRVFRMDGMSDISLSDQQPEEVGHPHRNAQQMVVIRFNDPFYLDLFYWDEIDVLQRDQQSLIARLPSYGGDWLAEHLAACGGSAQVNDAAIAERAAAIVRAYLS